MPEARPDPLQRFWGGLLMAIGGLSAGLCGLCTLVFTVSSLTTSGEFAGPGMLVLILPIGGIPTLIGGLLAWWGARLFWPKRMGPSQLAVFSDDPPTDGSNPPG